VAHDRIPPGVRRFVAEHIESVTQLELLLLLHRDPAAERTAQQCSRELQLPAGWVASQLERFAAAELVASTTGGDPRYSFRACGETAGLVDDVAETYRRLPTSMTALIFSSVHERSA
jgi:hypothetical protein